MLEFDLPENCTVVNVKRLHGRLTELSVSQSDVTIDVSAVTSVDAASLQALSAFVVAQRIAGHRTRWTGASDTFSDAARLLGLNQHLGLV